MKNPELRPRTLTSHRSKESNGSKVAFATIDFCPRYEIFDYLLDLSWVVEYDIGK